MIYVINDNETSGFKHWWHDVISCGLVVMNDRLEVIDHFYDTCQPWYPKNFNPDSTRAHGFTLPETMTFQPPEMLAKKIIWFLSKHRVEKEYFHFVAHDLNSFDFNFLESFFLKVGLQFSFRKVFNQHHRSSTIIKARDLGYENNGLGEWAKRLKKDFLHHNALDDAKMCADIFKHLINLEKETGHVTTISESKPKQTRKLHSKRTNKTEDGSELNLKGLQLTTF